VGCTVVVRIQHARRVWHNKANRLPPSLPPCSLSVFPWSRNPSQGAPAAAAKDRARWLRSTGFKRIFLMPSPLSIASSESGEMMTVCESPCHCSTCHPHLGHPACFQRTHRQRTHRQRTHRLPTKQTHEQRPNNRTFLHNTGEEREREKEKERERERERDYRHGTRIAEIQCGTVKRPDKGS